MFVIGLSDPSESGRTSCATVSAGGLAGWPFCSGDDGAGGLQVIEREAIGHPGSIAHVKTFVGCREVVEPLSKVEQRSLRVEIIAAVQPPSFRPSHRWRSSGGARSLHLYREGARGSDTGLPPFSLALEDRSLFLP